MIINHHVYAYTLRKETIEACLNEGYEVYLTLPYGDRVDLLTDMGCKFIDSPHDPHGTNPFQELKLIGRYRKIIKQVKPDVILSYTIKPNLYGGMIASWMKIPYIVNITGLGTAVEYPGMLQKMLTLIYKYSFKKVNCVFFQNTENRAFFEKAKIALGKHRLIPGSGVNTTKFSVMEYPEDKTTEFVFIARIMKEKGIEQYFEAAKYIRKKYPDTRFHICGSCDQEYGDILKELQNDGTVIYHGLVSDVREIFKITHCTVLPTYYPEGMANVLLESAASGRPIITTNRSGCREIIDDNVTGYIVNQQDSDDLIEKIEKFIKLSYEEKKQMGLNGRKKVENQFDRQIVVDAYMDEIKKVLGETR